MNKFFFIFTFFILLAAEIFSQTPMYYNTTAGASNNVFPFSVIAGKEVQWLILANDYSTPSPVPAGNSITAIYFYMGATVSNTLTDLTIKLGLSTITSLPAGVIYTGQLDTVYFRSSVTLSSTTGSWMMITLDRPYPYDITKSLIIDVSQCGATSTAMTVRQSTGSGARRCYINGTSSCVFTYVGQDASIINSGIDVVPAAPTACDFYSSLWCASGVFPNLPVASFFAASAWLGDTLYVQTPDAAGAATNTVRRYKYGDVWTLGVSLPGPKVGGSLTTCNGKLYYIGGGTSTITAGTNECLEYSAGAWVTKAPIPSILAAHGSVCWGDSVIFVIGGPYTGPTTTVYYYRPASNTWGTSTAMPSGSQRRTFACGISGNTIFVAAGYSGSAYLKSFYKGTIGSDASTITWAAGPDVPTTETGLSRPGGVGFQNYFYMVGGEKASGTGYSDICFVWNTITNAWSLQIPGKPMGVSNIFSDVTAKCINDTVKVFVPGGYNLAGIANFDVVGCGPSIVGVNKPVIETPMVYTLSQNYPNPFNPSTKIEFAIPKSANVELKVYDILGREVATLINEFKHAGNYSIEFNGGNISSGVYFYTLKSGDFKDTKKMLLIK